jgi:membrane-bound lytic murein transglycosylase F
VQDAQRLAEAHGDDPLNWDDVAHWMLQKSKREFFTHPVVRFGYVRGLEPVTYVQKILDRYRHYQEFVTEQPRALAARQGDPPAFDAPRE